MPIEVLNGQVLSPEDLDKIRRDLEAVAGIEAISLQLRGIVVRNWPHLVAKLPPEESD